MEQLYKEKCEQYERLEEEYNLFQEESMQLEQVQEERIQDLEKQVAQTQNKIIYLTDEVSKLKKENSHLNHKLEKITNQKDSLINELQNKVNVQNRKIVDLEIDLDQYINKNRELVEVHKDLENKIDKLLEVNAITQTDLEATKNNLQEEIERLQQQLKDNREEVFVLRHQRFSCSSTPEYVKMHTIDTVRANAAGFNKSLTLISALIKDLDEKMCLIRHQKAT